MAFDAIVGHNIDVCFKYDEVQTEMSRRALITKNIWSYL